MWNLLVCVGCAFAAGMLIDEKDSRLLMFANIMFCIANGIIVYGDMVK